MNKKTVSRDMDSPSDNRKSKIKNPKFALVVGAMLFALCLPAQAQQPAQTPRIGYVRSFGTAGGRGVSAFM